VRSPAHRVRLLHDQKAPARDGVRLSTDVVLPRDPGAYPTILLRTPYNNMRGVFLDRAVWFAARGYAVAMQDCRGRHESEGVFNAYAQEPHDGYDTFAWLRDQDWCNGKIGMWGRSYGSLIQWHVAPLRPPGLECLAAHVMADDYFNDYHYVGGAFQLALSIVAAIIWSTENTILEYGGAALFNNSRFYEHLPLIDLDVHALGHPVSYWREWLEHPTDGEYWRTVGTIGKAARINVPVFQQYGWFDPYARCAFRNLAALTHTADGPRARGRHRVLVGPWSHEDPEGTRMGQLDFGPRAAVDMREEELRWFDRWLRSDDGPAPPGAPIRIFVMGDNIWRDEEEWPLARTEYTEYYLHSGGRANSLYGDGRLTPEPPGQEPPDRYTYDPADPVPTLGGVNSLGTMMQAAAIPLVPGPVDQRPIERRDDVLVYTGPELERELEVTGPLDVVLYAESSARDTDFTAKLVDVYPDGRAMNITEGILRGRYRTSLERTELLEPETIDEFRIQLYPTSHVFKPHHRVRVDVSSSNFPRFSRNLNTGDCVATDSRMVVARQTVLHTGTYPSKIVLPVIPR
jgi:uncharacterized protein